MTEGERRRSKVRLPRHIQDLRGQVLGSLEIVELFKVIKDGKGNPADVYWHVKDVKTGRTDLCSSVDLFGGIS